MRLGDLEQLKEEILWGNVYLSDNEVNALVDAISNQPTIDPETLPIVQELRAELEKANKERDAAVNDLRDCAVEDYAECMYCSHRNKGTVLCQNCIYGSNWEWIGLKDENNSR